MGRVDVVLLPDQSALVSWMEVAGKAAEIRIRRVWPDGRSGDSMTIIESSKERAAGFPVMTVREGEVLFAWTEPGEPSAVRTASLSLKN